MIAAGHFTSLANTHKGKTQAKKHNCKKYQSTFYWYIYILFYSMQICDFLVAHRLKKLSH